jgi:uncharacterized protein with FMN-binding domain
MRIRRSPIVVAVTAAGVALVLTFNTHRQPSPVASTTSPTTSTSSSSAGSARSGSGSSGSGSSGSGSGSQASADSVTVAGAVESTMYGDVQVQITYKGGRITDVKALSLPSAEARSQELSAIAGPQLASQAEKAQSASIDGVSGATYTSTGYKASLQSAIDKTALES